MAPRIMVVCEQDKLAWPHLRFVLSNMSQNLGWINKLININHDAIDRALCVIYLCEIDRPLDLLKVLDLTRQSNATDPRDKLYGVLGLASDANMIVPHPDYSLSPIEVYTRLAKSLVDLRLTLDFLTLVRVDEQRSDLPSWCPDLIRGPPFSSINTEALGRTSRSAIQFEAAKDSYAIARFQGNMLTLSGFRLATVEGLGPRWNDDVATVIQAPSQCTQYEFRRKDNRLETFEALWKTFVAGLDLSSGDGPSPADPRFGYIFATQCVAAEYRFGKSETVSEDSDFTWWYDRNRDLQICGRTIYFLCGENLEPAEEVLNSFHDTWKRTNSGRRLIVTDAGYVGLVPEQVCRGDTVCVLLGGRMPVILGLVEGGHIS